jgi:hypothetical protein
MVVVLVVVLAGLVVGGLGTAAAVRWPVLDPAAPHLTRRAIRHAVEDHPGWDGMLRRRTDPGAITGLLLTVAVTVVVAAVVAVGVLLAMVTTETGLQRGDLPVTQWAAEQTREQAGDELGLISRLGGNRRSRRHDRGAGAVGVAPATELGGSCVLTAYDRRAVRVGARHQGAHRACPP